MKPIDPPIRVETAALPFANAQTMIARSITNAACRLLAPGRIELVSGVNVPMLLRVLSYRTLGMNELLRKAMSGGTEGIVRAALPAPASGANR